MMSSSQQMPETHGMSPHCSGTTKKTDWYRDVDADLGRQRGMEGRVSCGLIQDGVFSDLWDPQGNFRELALESLSAFLYFYFSELIFGFFDFEKKKKCCRCERIVGNSQPPCLLKMSWVPATTLRKYFALSLDGVSCYYLHFTDVEMECVGWVKSRGQGPIACVRARITSSSGPKPLEQAASTSALGRQTLKSAPRAWPYGYSQRVKIEGILGRKRKMLSSNLPLRKPRHVWT